MGRRRERDGEGHHSHRSRSKDAKKSFDKKVRNDRRPTIPPRPPRGITLSASRRSPTSGSSSTGTSESLLGEGDPPRSRKRKKRHDGGRAAEDDATYCSGGRGGSVVTEKRTTSKARKKAKRMTDVPDKKREKKRQKKRDREDRKIRGVEEEKVKKHSKRRREEKKLLLLSSSSQAQTASGDSSTSNNGTDGSARANDRTLAQRPSTEDALGTVSHRARSHPPAVEMGTDRAAPLPPPSEPAGSSQESSAASCREARAKAMVPMRPEEYTAQQKNIREVFDEDTGRWRLVRGTGEIIERIVSRREQHAIQQHASRWGWDHKAMSGAAVMPSGSSLGGR